MQDENKKEPTGKAKGGKARAAKMSPDERKEASKRMVKAKAEIASLPKVMAGSKDEPLRIGEIELECYVLDDADKTRIITAGAAGVGLGFHPASASARLVNLVTSDRITPFINKELANQLQSPIRFKYPSSKIIGSAYPATILADICDAILAARKDGKLQAQQAHIAKRAELLMRGFARVGIVALVDEATGWLC